MKVEIKIHQILHNHINKIISIIKLEKTIKEILIDKITQLFHHQLIVLLIITMPKIPLHTKEIMLV